MTRAPDWTEAEFEQLLAQPQASAEDMHQALPQRSEGAIKTVRSGIHEFHTRGTTTLLSQLLIGKLEDPSTTWTCPVCGAVRQ
jgi:hypothetical protein